MPCALLPVLRTVKEKEKKKKDKFYSKPTRGLAAVSNFPEKLESI